MIKNSRKRKITNPHHRAILYPHISDNSHLLALKSGYQMSPPPSQIFHHQFKTNGLTISFGSTSLKWNGIIDLSKLNSPLWMLLDFGQNSVEVYPDNILKPEKGEELNKSCIATFRKKRRVCVAKLEAVCKKSGCELLCVDSVENKIMIEIPHFTKYVFSQQEEEPETLLKALKNSQINRNLNEMSRNIPVQFPQSSLTRTTPSHQLLEQINQHNTMNHQLPHETKTMSIPRGNGYILNYNSVSTNNSNCITFFQSNAFRDGQIASMIALAQNLINLNEIILDKREDFRKRRFFSLYLICFRFDLCQFRFSSQSGQFEIEKANKPSECEKKLYLKDWFQWVLNKQNHIEFPQPEIYKCLAKRDLSNLIDRFLKYNSFDDAQFLACIEDQIYRLDDSERKICKQLQRIMMADMRPFENSHWLIRIGTLLWYYAPDVEVQREFQRIISRVEEDEFSMELHLLKCNFQYKRKNTVEGAVNREEIPYWWFISQCERMKEKQLFDEKQYHKYRLRLMRKLLMDIDQPQTIEKIIKLDQELRVSEKEEIVTEILKLKWNNPRFVRHISLQNYVNEQKAWHLYSNKKYLLAFENFANLPSSKTNIQIMLQILQKQEILTTYKQDEIQKIQEILSVLKEKTFFSHHLLFQLRLGKTSFQLDSLYKMDEFTKERLSANLRKRVMNILFENMGKLSEFMHYIVNNGDFYRKMEQIYGNDRQKLIQIKMAKISS